MNSKKNFYSVIKELLNTKKGITFVHDIEIDEFVPYQEIYEDSVFLVKNLRRKGIVAGDSMCIQIEDRRTYVTAIWACLLGGITGVPLSTDSKLDTVKKNLTIWKQLDMPYVMSEEAQMHMMEYQAQKLYADNTISMMKEKMFFMDDCKACEEELNLEQVERDKAFILFSSGSTGDPKGVILTHNNILSNVQCNIKANGITEEDSCFCWMPMTHGMGLLLFHLAALAGKNNQYIMTTDTFLRNPRIWFDKVTKYKISILYSPNFGYRLLLDNFNEKLCRTWDLSSIRCIMNGAEPISYDLIKQFEQRMEEYGLRKNVFVPLYGLTETAGPAFYHPVGTPLVRYCLNRHKLNVGDEVELVSSADAEGVSYISVGKIIPACSLRICDDKDQDLEEGRVGYIKLSGESVSTLYRLNGSKDVSVFRVDGYLDTGDIGVLKDGCLVITGRRKEIIIVNGCNIYPQDIEAMIQKQIPSISGKIAVCGVFDEQSKTDEIVAFVEMNSAECVLDIQKQIVESVSMNIGATVKQVIPVDKFEKTESGKVKRTTMSKKFADGEYDEIINELKETQKTEELKKYYSSKENVLFQIWQMVKETLNVEQISMSDSFFAYGGNSIKAAKLVSSIEKHFHITIPKSQLFETPTIEKLADYVFTHLNSSFAEIERVGKKEYYEVSSAQRRMYFSSQLSNDKMTYNTPVFCKITGELNQELVRSACEKLLKRHQILRTGFELREGEPVQVIHDDAKLNFSFEDLRKREFTKKELNTYMQNSVEPFELNAKSLFAVKLFQYGEAEYMLLFSLHHIIFDGSSIDILLKEFNELYHFRNLPELKIQYVDYANWEKQNSTSPQMKAMEQYWIDKLDGDIPPLALPFDFSRPKVAEHKGATVKFRLNSWQTKELENIAQKTNTTLYMVLLSIYNIMLYKYSGQKDIAVGTPVAGRNHSSTEEIIGMFVNTIVMRNEVKPENGVLDYIENVRTNTIEAFKNSDYQFDRLVEKLGYQTDVSVNPVYNTVFALQNMSVPQVNEEFSLKVLDLFQESAKFDLSLMATEDQDGIQFDLVYDIALFENATMERMKQHFINLVEQIIERPNQKIADISMLSEKELKTILVDFNQPEVPFEENSQCVIKMFEHIAAEMPEKVALIYEEQVMTYEELNRKANQVAAKLRKNKVRPNDVVSVIMDQSFSLYIAILGILKVGAAFLPVDTEYPVERINYMLQDSKTRIIITDLQDINKYDFDGLVIYENDVKDESEELDSSFADIRFDDTAYVIYTSGSTGNPKGTLISHKSLLNLCLWHCNEFQVTAQDKSTKYAKVGFDASVWEIFPYLICGASQYIVSKSEKLDIFALNESFKKQQITISFLPTQICEQFMELENTSSLRILLTGGDKLRRYTKKPYAVVNNYGPTENTVVTTSFWIDKDYANIPIGKPIRNTQVYIVSEDCNLQPVGVAGELWIAGDGIAKGYLDNEELTREKFVLNPFTKTGRVYKTGDLAKWTKDGNIEFMGRKDTQVKIRGYRIEIGEIEKQLLEYDSISEATVMIRVLGENKVLCAYYVSKEEIPVHELKKFLERKLPDYMIPGYFTKLSAMPVSSNGKIDRKALNQIALSQELTQEQNAEPRNETEKIIFQMYQKLLGISSFGIYDDFYALGGHSVLAMKAVAELRKQFGVSVSLLAFMQNRTVEDLARLVMESSSRAKSSSLYSDFVRFADKDKPYELTEVQQAYLFGRDKSFDIGGVSTHAYFEFESCIDIDLFNQCLQKEIDRHEMLRMVVTNDGKQEIRKDNCYYQVKAEDISELDEEQKNKKIEETRQSMQEHVFDVEKWPLFDIKAFVTDRETGTVTIGFCFDPIILDTSSLEIIITEMIKLYQNIDVEVPKLGFTFADYIESLKAFKKSEVYQKDKEFWMNKLEEFPSAPMLPLKMEPADVDVPVFRSHRHVIPQNVLKVLKEEVGQKGLSLSAFLAMVYAEVLAFWSNKNQFALNLTVFNRYSFHEDVSSVVGDFTSVILLDVDIKKNVSFWDNAQQLQTKLLEYLEHRHFEGLQFSREISKKNGMTTQAVFPVVFTSVLDTNEESALKTIDYNTIKHMYTRTSQTFIDNQVIEMDGGLLITWDYVEQLFDQNTIDAMFHQYVELILAFAEDTGKAEKTVCSICQKVDKLYRAYNDTDDETIHSQTLTSFLKNSVELYPEKKAVICQEESITYAELEKRSNQVARYLMEQEIGTGSFVGVLGERCIETIVNIMGVLKTGAAYIPVLPDYPQDRIRYILEQADCKVMLTKELTLSDEIQSFGTDKVACMENQQSPAYIIYTSGSTGRPKGVVISHEAAANTILDMNRRFHIQKEDKVIGLSSFCFDLSVYDIFGSIEAGASLVLIQDQRDAEEIAQVMQKHEITVWNSVPAIMDMLIKCMDDNKVVKSLKSVFMSGDWIPLALPEMILKHFPNAKPVSLGGATEASIWSIYYPIGEVNKDWKSIPYGMPLANQKMYILNYENQLCPCGVQGEICIGGAGVAMGYHKDEEKTAKAFVNVKGLGRIYKTGDYGVFHEEGYIEFLGRKDEQVKVRGYRIELGEIQNVLCEHESIADAVVLADKDEKNNQFLSAYYVSDKEFANEELKEILKQKVPEYMIPSFFMRIDEIPLTANGKVNRKALPKIELPSMELPEDYFDSATELEKELAQLCMNELEISTIDLDESFFSIGIDSIRMMQIKTKLSKLYGVNVSFHEFIANNSIRKLAALIQSKDKDGEEIVYEKAVLDIASQNELFPLTDVQMSYLLGRDSKFEMGGISTHGYIEVKTKLDIKRLNQALIKLIHHQPMLRAVVYKSGEQQILKDVPDYEIKNVDVSSYSEQEKENFILKERDRMSHYIFDTEKWPLFEFSACTLDQENNYLFMGFDLLIADGASMQILLRELLAYYNGESIEDMEFSYRDYLLKYKEFEESEVVQRDKEYWKAKLPDFPMAPEVPLKCKPSDVKNPHFKRCDYIFEKAEWNVLTEQAKKYNVTPSALICTAYAKVLAMWSGQQRMAINSTVFTRYPFHEDVNKIIGDFTSIMLLDIDIKPEETFWEQVRNVQAVFADALDHRHYDGIKFIRDIASYHNMGTKSKMPIVFTSLLMNQKEVKFQGWNELGEVVKTISQTSQVFIDHQISELDNELLLSWDYVDELFEPEIIQAMFDAYISILKQVIDKKDVCLSLNDRQSELLRNYNETDCDLEKGTLHGLFTKQAKQTPDLIAVKCYEDEITYEGLEERSNQIANYLMAQGIEKGDFVAINADRKIETIANILGVLKAGAAYIPLEPSYPEERKTTIVHDSGSKMVLCWNDYVAKNMDVCDKHLKPVDMTPDDLAYVIYTSGSTGKPKGVIISHGGAVNTILDINQKYDVTQSDRIIGLSSLCFDLSVYDIFGSLLSGACLVMVKDQRDMEDIHNIVKQNHITVWNSVPAIMDTFISHLVMKKPEEVNYWSGTSQQIAFDEGYSLRLVMMSGDWIPVNLPEKIEEMFDEPEVISLGGATEASIWSIYHPVDSLTDSKLSSIPYGRPLANQKMYILNSSLQQCPIGVLGEICIGGAGVARGYLNDPEKTSQSFVVHPEWGYIYKTGDYGKMTAKGYIQFLGRRDHQVKIRGYRIELGEIEACIRKNPKVEKAVVVDRVSKTGVKYICAYIMGERNIEDELKAQLIEVLPQYMVPEYFVNLEEIPLTKNGKVNRELLPAPEDENKLSFVAPRNELEKDLADMWMKALHLKEVSVLSSIFEIGGDSIMIVKMTNEIMKTFKVQISFVDFLRNNTIEKLAAFIASMNKMDCQIYQSFEIDKENLYEPFPLTDVQTAYLLGRDSLFEMGGTSTHGYSEIETKLNMERFNESLVKLIDRHEMLRAIVLPDGTQCILKSVPEYKIEITDLTQASEEERNRMIMKERQRMSHYIFDTTKWPLFEFKAFKLDEETHYLFMGFDLLIADGASMMLFGKELLDYYAHPEKELPPINFTFRDYMIALNYMKNGDIYKKDEAYWVQKLEYFPGAVELPLLENPENIRSPHFKHITTTIQKENWNKIKKVAAEINVTPSAMLCTAFAQVLAKCSNQTYFGLNVTVFNRYPFHENVNQIIGDFTSVLPLDITIAPGKTIQENAAAVQNILLEGLQHRHFDGIKFIRLLTRRNGMSTSATLPIVFTSMLLGKSIELGDNAISLGEEKMRVSQTSQVYLDHQVMENNGDLVISWDYVEQLYDSELIKHMFSEYINHLYHLIDMHVDTIEDGSFMRRLEQKVERYNDTSEEIMECTLQSCFEQQAWKNPDKVAISCESRTITYSELDERSNQVARSIRAQNIGTGDYVCVIADKSIETVVNILGILKAGACYVPMLPDYPKNRIDYICKNCNSRLLIDADYYEKQDVSRYEKKPLALFVSPESMAYVIYTSGSTGNPKGVMITHKAAMNTILAVNKKYSVKETDNIIGLSSFCFDLSVYDLFGTLSAGATLVLVKEARNAKELLDIIERKKITIWNSVPSTVELLTSYMEDKEKEEEAKVDNYWQMAARSTQVELINCSSLRLIMMSGDWIPLTLPEKINTYFEGAEIYSYGGATEASIWSIFYPVNKIKKEWKSIPYGMPLANQKIYVLDYDMDICPANVPGEIYIGGKGVASGYLADPERTKASFIMHEKYGRLYRTGDYGMFHEEGYVEFLGRKDNQVKIGGYRIETGEIDARIQEIDSISNALTIADEDINKKKYLLSYVITSEEIDELDLREKLLKVLPEYMIPRKFVSIKEFPLTSNGKVDVKQLRKMNSEAVEHSQKVWMKTESEKIVEKIWCNILGLERISVTDNLFDIGASSASVITFIATVSKEYDIKIDLKTIFRYPYIQKIAKEFEQNLKERKAQKEQEAEWCVRMNQESGKNVFCFPSITTLGLSFKDLAKNMKDCTVYSFDYFESEDIIAKYVEDILKIQKESPYVLVGYSAGGYLAYEVAKRLEELGKTVLDIILIDTYFVPEELKADDSSLKDKIIQNAIAQVASGDKYKDNVEAVYEERISHYLDEVTNIVISSKVHANIHLVKASEDQSYMSQMREYMDDWGKYTYGNFITYNSTEKHYNVIAGKKSAIIVDIIENIYYNIQKEVSE